MSTKARNWTIVLLLPLILFGALLFSYNADMKLALYLSVTTFVILVWAFEVLPSVHAALLLPILYVVLEIAPANVVFRPWFTFLPWVCVAGLIFGDILGRTGLARRIALACVKFMGGSFSAIVIGLMLAGIILVFIVPSIMARVVIFYAITCGFADALDVKKESRMSSALLIAGFFAATSPSTLVMTGAEQNLLGISMINAKREVITWNLYLLHNLPLGMIYCAFSVVLAHMVKGKDTLPSKESVTQMVSKKLAEMGKTTFVEYKILFLLVLGVTAFIILGATQGPWYFTLAACLAFFPGFSLISEKDLRGLNFGFIFFVTGCMAIGFGAAHLGIPAKIGDMMAPLLQGKSGVMAIIASYLAGLGLNFLLTPLAATSSMSGPLVAVADALCMNPAPFIYSFIYGLEQYIFPYEYALLLFFFMDNRITLKHIIPPLALRMVLTLLLLIAVAYPYWRFMGIM